jgi:hypothetical protein
VFADAARDARQVARDGPVFLEVNDLPAPVPPEQSCCAIL